MIACWFQRAWIDNQWQHDVRLTVTEGRISALETGVGAAPGDERHAAALPGLCNVHSHGFQRGMAGLSERRSRHDDNFWSWREIMYRFLDRLTPDDVAAITAQAYAEMLEGGFTRVGEFHYLHHDPAGRTYADPAEMAGAIVDASSATGIGLTLLPVFYAHGNFGGASPSPGQRRFLSDIDGFAALLDSARTKLVGDANIGIAPHSLRAVAPDQLTALLAMSPIGPVHIHAAEQEKEVADCIAWSGARPVAWLLDNAALDARWCLIHSTHLDADEAARLAASGAVAGLCPITEANLGDGIFPAIDYLAAGGRFGIGTDSNILIDAAGELRALEYSQRLAHRARALLAGTESPFVGANLYARALAGGGQALGVEPGLAVGQPADIVSLDLDHPSFAGTDDATLLDRWIFAGRAGTIDCVWRAGVKRVAGGRHVDRSAIAAAYRKSVERIVA
ncbi:formimidoylglutamate deiminase [Sphingopyxis bauzanensis]|uniref:Formimidoylglutamate deiminase n=1 Tax=Sphingopyxis bauzanensis TaxID=651663 RepID=A0A246JT00_9SPHN|nr:formimidoylglutamate deiminase [Sphingopyxis bauzanensis]OWQ96098.1 formimidoylglutamate deiminase [Sphingopyxis bauzanensis]GGJ35980.1 formimidoylglutamate deiminase [Sphingopyxis bauzanensis]